MPVCRRTAAVSAGLLAVLLTPAPLVADGGSGYDPSLESNPRNSPVDNAGPTDPRIYRNPNQQAAEFGYDSLNQAAFLLFFDKTTRFNMFTGRTERGKITYIQAPLTPVGNAYRATPAGLWAFHQASDYFEKKHDQELRNEQKQRALAAGKSAAATAQPARTVPAKPAPQSDEVGTSVSFRWSASASLSLRADFRNWSDSHDLQVNLVRYTVHPLGLSYLQPWGAGADAKPDASAASDNSDDSGLRPESQTRDEVGKGNLLFEIDLKQLLGGGGMTRLDPPTPGLLEDDQSWDGFESQLKAGGWSGTLDLGTSAIMSRYFFTTTPAEQTIPDGGLVDSFSYDLDFKPRAELTVPLRRVWADLDTLASNELPVERFTLGVRFDY